MKTAFRILFSLYERVRRKRDPREHGHHNKLPATGLACRANEAGSMSFIWTYPIAWSTDKACPSVDADRCNLPAILAREIVRGIEFPSDGRALPVTT
ncbi:hypothetical protein [Paraburkholderia sartisoli]|uniref:hypothetical protein n=1 Tax=Paraburkholderia sartisoli TaxID=83784 RepID=UPI0011607CE9|nr:hypothetical protein [Paraburkholderia sartisoli]